MHFDLVDAVLECSDDRIVTIKQVSAAEEYLQDHFPSFPVLPGVLMIETLVQAARRLIETRHGRSRMVLGSVRALKYASFIRPGETLRVEVTLAKANPDGTFDFRGEGSVLSPGGDAPPRSTVSGRFVLRPLAIQTISLASTLTPEPLSA